MSQRSKKIREGLATLDSFLTSKGWERDRWGHFKKVDKSGGLRRVKIQRNSWRYERQVVVPKSDYSPARKFWTCLGGGYLSMIRISGDKLVSTY